MLQREGLNYTRISASSCAEPEGGFGIEGNTTSPAMCLVP
jgi:hypothetical protein